MRTLLLAGLTGIVLVSSSEGAIINSSSVTAGTTNANLGFGTISTPTGTFATPSQNGFTGIGVAGGVHTTQVDGNEKIVVNFFAGMSIDEIQIGFLYHTGAITDTVDERMQVLANGSLVGVLTATGTTTATWTGSGTVTNVSPSQNGFGGVWKISGPFGSTSVTSLEFMALPYNNPVTLADSDFALISVTATPEPATAALMGLGLLALGLLRRK